MQRVQKHFNVDFIGMPIITEDKTYWYDRRREETQIFKSAHVEKEEEEANHKWIERSQTQPKQP
jgi:hypothetical protein